MAREDIIMLSSKEKMLVRNILPDIFSKSGPNCIAGPCTEGDMYCGKIDEAREKFKGL